MPNILPPEWHRQDAVMLTWPHADTDWATNLMAVEKVFIELSEVITAQQHLVVVCHNEAIKQHVFRLLTQANVNTELILCVISPTNDSWARDHGPLSVINENGQVTALDFIFNGWGGKYPAKLDNKINQALCKQLNVCQRQPVNIVLEGGGIDVDEQGHLLTTKHCLLNQNRNPDMSEHAVEQMLQHYFGVKKVLWLRHGALQGDDTDSHIDTLARFAPAQTIVYQACQDKTDSHFVDLENMKKELMAMRSIDGQKFSLLALPWPDAQYNAQGDRLPATYANFLVINKVVIVPSYGVSQDKLAQKVIQQAFPCHLIIGVNCRAIIEQFGSLHCLTMQLPQGFLLKENIHEHVC